MSRAESKHGTVLLCAICSVILRTLSFSAPCIEMMKEREEGNKVDDEEIDHEERRWYNSPHAIISISAGFFLFSLRTLEMIPNDPEIPEQRVRVKRRL